MSLFSQIIRCCQTSRSSTYDTDFLSCICQLFSFSLPVRACIMIRCITFDITDGHCLIDFFSLTFQFTHMGTDITKSLREWYFLTNDSYCFIILLVFHVTDIARNICMCRTSMTTRYDCIFSLHFGIHQLIADCSGRTNFCTCSAETTICIFQ